MTTVSFRLQSFLTHLPDWFEFGSAIGSQSEAGYLLNVRGSPVFSYLFTDGGITTQGTDGWCYDVSVANVSDFPRKTPAVATGTYVPGSKERRSIKCVTNAFANWLKEHPRLETRNFNDIAPGNLDEYLAVYFSIVKRQNGCNYLPKTFKSIREDLARHLRETGYPHCIVRSPLFLKSQLSFKIRFHDLRNDVQSLGGDRFESP